MLFCPLFNLKRACFYGKITSIIPHFSTLSDDEKMEVILCPTSDIMTKVVNKFIRIMFNARDKIDEGIDLSQTCYPTYTPPFNFVNSTSYDEFSDCDVGEANFSSSSSVSSEDQSQLNISRVVT